MKRWYDPRRLGFAALSIALYAACGEPETQHLYPAERPFREFQAVFPTLIRDCGFHACHGSTDRFFHLWGPGRARLDPDTRAFGAVTGDEVSVAFQLTLSMIDSSDPERSPLLRKPLAVAAGGDGHGGVDYYGRDVYRTTEDEGYLAIRRFVLELDAEAE